MSEGLILNLFNEFNKFSNEFNILIITHPKKFSLLYKKDIFSPTRLLRGLFKNKQD